MSKVPAPAIALIASLESRFVRMKLAVGAVIGLVAGALIGGLAFGTLASDSTATAFLRLQNPADLTAIAGGASQVTPDNQGNTADFVTGEIAYLSGEGFAQAVARKMAQDDPAVLNVAQASESSVVTISYSSSSSDESIRTVQTAIDLYGQELSQRVDEQLRTLLPTLDKWQQRNTTDPVRTQDLQRVRESVELQAAEASRLLVVQPPIPNHPSSQQWLIGAFLGALVGGSGVIAVLLARRRRSGRSTLVSTLTDSVDGVLLPAVDLDQSRTAAEDQTRLGRALYTQCLSAEPDRVILVIGASESSGSAVIAALLEAARSTTARVVDGGTVGDSTVNPGIVADATDIVLVARMDVDTVAQVLALRSAAASGTAPVVAVFTYRRAPGLRSKGSE